MDNILPENEYTEVDGRAYLNPQVSLDESNTFIDNLRSAQGQQNQEIFSDTQRLGTDVPSNLGGLTGANSYFTSRYQTPQTGSAAASLRAAAQAQALNQILQDEQAIWKKKYQDAYKNYQKSAYNRAYGRSSGSGSGGGTTTGGGADSNTSTWSGEIEDIVSDGSGGYTAVSKLTLDANDIAQGGKYVVDPGTGNIIRVDDTLSVNDPNYQMTYYQQSDGSYKAPVQRNSGLLQNTAPLAGALRSSL